MEEDTMLEEPRRSIPVAVRLSQRLAAGTFAVGMMAGFAGHHFRAPALLLILIFAVCVLVFARLWGRISSLAFDRLLGVSILLSLIGATLQMVAAPPAATIGSTVIPIGVAAAAVVAALGFQSSRPDASALRAALISAVLVLIGLIAGIIWRVRVWQELDRVILAAGMLMAGIATVANIVQGYRRPPAD